MSMNPKTAQRRSHRGTKKKKVIKTSEDSIRDLLNNSKWNDICIIGVPEEKRERME